MTRTPASLRDVGLKRRYAKSQVFMTYLAAFAIEMLAQIFLYFSKKVFAVDNFFDPSTSFLRPISMIPLKVYVVKTHTILCLFFLLSTESVVTKNMSLFNFCMRNFLTVNICISLNARLKSTCFVLTITNYRQTIHKLSTSRKIVRKQTCLAVFYGNLTTNLSLKLEQNSFSSYFVLTRPHIHW